MVLNSQSVIALFRCLSVCLLVRLSLFTGLKIEQAVCVSVCQVVQNVRLLVRSAERRKVSQEAVFPLCSARTQLDTGYCDLNTVLVTPLTSFHPSDVTADVISPPN